MKSRKNYIHTDWYGAYWQFSKIFLHDPAQKNKENGWNGSDDHVQGSDHIPFGESRDLLQRRIGKRWGSYAVKLAAAGAHFPIPWLFLSLRIRPDDRVDYCVDCSFLPWCKHQVLVFTLERTGARPVGEQRWVLGPQWAFPAKCHLAVPNNCLV